MDTRGACVVHETRPDTFFATAGYRADLGPIWTFNPDRLGGIPSTFRWAMTQGCADPMEAFYRAADLVGGIANHGEMPLVVGEGPRRPRRRRPRRRAALRRGRHRRPGARRGPPGRHARRADMTAVSEF